MVVIERQNMLSLEVNDFEEQGIHRTHSHYFVVSLLSGEISKKNQIACPSRHDMTRA